MCEFIVFIVCEITKKIFYIKKGLNYNKLVPFLVLLAVNVCDTVQFVELEGLEPSSKQVTKQLSTCLVYF